METTGPIVLMPLDDLSPDDETVYLLRSSANAANLRASIQQYEKGEYCARNLIEE